MNGFYVSYPCSHQTREKEHITGHPTSMAEIREEMYPKLPTDDRGKDLPQRSSHYWPAERKEKSSITTYPIEGKAPIGPPNNERRLSIHRMRRLIMFPTFPPDGRRSLPSLAEKSSSPFMAEKRRPPYSPGKGRGSRRYEPSTVRYGTRYGAE